MKSTVALLRTTPQTVVDDIRRLMKLAPASDALEAGATTILKNNLS
mgnify:FL=1